MPLKSRLKRSGRGSLEDSGQDAKETESTIHIATGARGAKEMECEGMVLTHSICS